MIQQLKRKCHELRQKVLKTCIQAGTGHVTSCMSCVEIMVALYYGGILRFQPKNPTWEERDRFILSKAQASPLLYTILADCGFYSPTELEKFAQGGGIFGVHLQHTVPGVETTAGALGHGLGLASGIATAGKMDQKLFMTVVLLGDGELYEGSIWESAQFAAQQRLNNLVAIVDRNGMCTTDFTENIIALEPLTEKWQSLGWQVTRINGHRIEEIIDSLKNFRRRALNKPSIIIADTVKGYGIQSMSYRPLCHGIAPKGEEAELALQQLNCEVD